MKEITNAYRKTKWGRIEGEVANATTKFLVHHGSLSPEVVDPLLSLVLSENGMNISTQRLEMYVRFCVESVTIYTNNAQKYFDLFKQLPDKLKMRLVVHTKIALLFETTQENRFRYLEHLETIKSEAWQWRANLYMTGLHHKLIDTDGENIEECDDLFRRRFTRIEMTDPEEGVSSESDTSESSEENDEVKDTHNDSDEISLRLRRRLGRDVMKHYLMKGKVEEAQSLVDLFE